jgi:hypothetical protein
MAQLAHGGSRPRVVATLSLVLVAVLAAACAAAPPPPSPTPRPTPLVTPNPHLPDPASAQDVFNGLGRQGLKITTNTAAAGADDAAVITRINATYLGWPLHVTQFRTSADLAAAAKWKAGEAPGRGEAPVALAGSNILIQWGPRTAGAKPQPPDDRQRAALDALAAALDVLLSPIRMRTIVPVDIATAAAPPASAGPSAAPRTTPAP